MTGAANTDRHIADCHMHVFGDPARYPPAARRAYTPSEKPFAEWRAMAASLGVDRVVLVQPSAYGTDNACMLDALRAAGGMARGVAVIDAATPDAALADMRAIGVRGVRLNLVNAGVPDPAAAVALLRATAARVAPLGWHVQLYAHDPVVTALAEAIPSLGVTVVFDHLAGATAARGLDQPGLQAVLGLLRAGRCWVKLSGADHAASHREAFREALPIMRALVAANPERLVWGSDWPHILTTGSVADPRPAGFLGLDNGALLQQMREVAGEAAGRILADGPAQLYDWAAPAA